MNFQKEKQEADSVPRVLIDCDGVLSNFREQLFHHAKIEPFEITEWGFIGKDERMSWDVAHKAVCRAGFCLNMQPYDGAREFVNHFEDSYIVTSPWYKSPYWVDERYTWLRRHIKFPTNRVVVTGAKYLCKGDYLIDDKLDNVVKWCKAWPQGKGIVFSNLDMHKELPENAVRLTTYQEVIDYVDKNRRKDH